ncbi:MAG: carbonic anhydrase [Spirochaetota bacterium]
MRSIQLFLLFCASAILFPSTTGKGISAHDARERLTAGNKRFTTGTMQHGHMTSARRMATAKDGQRPFATVLTCSDSRVPPEVLFDTGLGDVFVVRVAGNVCAANEAGSIEYGAGHVGTRLVVVLGHTKCGAVTAVVKGEHVSPVIAKLVKPITPAAYRAHIMNGPCCVEKEIRTAIALNIFNAITDLFRQSAELRSLVREGKAEVVGALYDIESGKVHWLGKHTEERSLIRTR